MAAQYENEEDRLWHQFGNEWTEGWKMNDPKSNPSWPLANNPYPSGTDQHHAFNLGWNARTNAKED